MDLRPEKRQRLPWLYWLVFAVIALCVGASLVHTFGSRLVPLVLALVVWRAWRWFDRATGTKDPGHDLPSRRPTYIFEIPEPYLFLIVAVGLYFVALFRGGMSAALLGLLLVWRAWRWFDRGTGTRCPVGWLRRWRALRVRPLELPRVERELRGAPPRPPAAYAPVDLPRTYMSSAHEVQYGTLGYKQQSRARLQTR